jgi:predicted DNA-binding protein
MRHKRKYERKAPLKGLQVFPTSVALTPEQLELGKKISKQKGITFSQLVRELLDKHMTDI